MENQRFPNRSVTDMAETKRRVFLVVLDSVGAGEAPDADRFGDKGTHTLRSVHASGQLCIPHLLQAGLGNIEGLSFLGQAEKPTAAHARMQEKSAGKDTTVGHWEIAGVCSERPLPTYPHGFPADLLDAFSRRTGRGVLCNLPYSGTEVIRDYGDEHVRSGKLIVYTSADSVFQIAAHESVVPPEELYVYCRMARELLVEKHGVGRVIARPFCGESGAYTRTTNRRDFSLAPPRETLLDRLQQAGMDCIAVGKIHDIFAGRGITRSIPTHGNREGIEQLQACMQQDFSGLCFVNLVDFDMLYGHRNDAVGYARALNEFDACLSALQAALRPNDLLCITADHGCDPGDVSTDHTREYTPMLLFGAGVAPVNLGTRHGFAGIAATFAQALGVEFACDGSSFWEAVCRQYQE